MRNLARDFQGGPIKNRSPDVHLLQVATAILARRIRDYQSYCNAELMASGYPDRFDSLFAEAGGTKDAELCSPFNGVATLITDAMNVTLRSPLTVVFAAGSHKRSTGYFDLHLKHEGRWVIAKRSWVQATSPRVLQDSCPDMRLPSGMSINEKQTAQAFSEMRGHGGMHA